MILCYLYDGMADFEVTFLLHRLRNQGHRTIVGIAETLEPVTAQSGLTYYPDKRIQDILDISDVEALMMPGGPVNEEQNAICPLARQLADAGKLIGAICFAPQFLGRAGILADHTFTTSCSAEKVRQTGQKDPYPWENYVAARVHQDRNILTAQGYAFVDFAKAVCRKLHVFSEEQEEYEMLDVVKNDAVL